jgi:hypothetical protein
MANFKADFAYLFLTEEVMIHAFRLLDCLIFICDYFWKCFSCYFYLNRLSGQLHYKQAWLSGQLHYKQVSNLVETNIFRTKLIKLCISTDRCVYCFIVVLSLTLGVVPVFSSVQLKVHAQVQLKNLNTFCTYIPLTLILLLT